MTKLRLVLLATTAVTAMPFASSASHAQTAPIVVAQQGEVGPDGKPTPVVTVPPSALIPEVIQAMEKTLNETSPGVPLVATMSAGASDGKFTRIANIPTFGVSCMFYELGDNRAHGKDERMAVQDFYDGITFNYKLIRALSSSSDLGN